MKRTLRLIFSLFILILSACQPRAADPSPAAQSGGLKVLAVESFLADIAQNIAGDRVQVQSLIPLGLDPHAFEPTPRDVALIASSQVLIVNGHGLEDWLSKVLDNAGGQRLVIVASAGLQSRTPREGELSGTDATGPEGDPHFWLDPQNVIRYAANIRDGLSQADPAGRQAYAQNTDAYIASLNTLDAWIQGEVAQVPPARRLLVTNHESLGYFADRYGFSIVGTIVPSVSTSAEPSARQLAGLVQKIQQSGARAIFLETSTNPQMATQIAREAKIEVVTGLYTHSTSAKDGLAPTYLDMMKADTTMIVDALK